MSWWNSNSAQLEIYESDRNFLTTTETSVKKWVRMTSKNIVLTASHFSPLRPQTLVKLKFSAARDLRVWSKFPYHHWNQCEKLSQDDQQKHCFNCNPFSPLRPQTIANYFYCPPAKKAKIWKSWDLVFYRKPDSRLKNKIFGCDFES